MCESLTQEIVEIPDWYYKVYYRLFGDWELVGKEYLDQTPKAVVLALPHTSNHDAAAMLALRAQHKIPLFF